jgi:predicted HicB family RNase H-like nuclease
MKTLKIDATLHRLLKARAAKAGMKLGRMVELMLRDALRKVK